MMPLCQDNGGQAAIRVLIADDHVTVLEGLTAIIGRQGDMAVAAEAANGREALAQWLCHRPDVTLLDLRMPELDGIEVAHAIRQTHPQARIIVLTTLDSEVDIDRARQAGVAGFLLKDAPREELLGCIRAVHSGVQCMPSASRREDQSCALTFREIEVLRELALGRSNKAIAAHLCISETTVKSHLRNIFAKFNVLSRTEALAQATRRGLIQY